MIYIYLTDIKKSTSQTSQRKHTRLTSALTSAFSFFPRYIRRSTLAMDLKKSEKLNDLAPIPQMLPARSGRNWAKTPKFSAVQRSGVRSGASRKYSVPKN